MFTPDIHAEFSVLPEFKNSYFWEKIEPFSEKSADVVFVHVFLHMCWSFCVHWQDKWAYCAERQFAIFLRINAGVMISYSCLLNAPLGQWDICIQILYYIQMPSTN